ncbi:VanW family protein [Clostridium gasigenes]|uniref:VanW family protein n=1 Tax=Clostridium gasigenes TaxID=94869 RepID=UPI00209B25EB|nr:VanW family protein [Clostridium gasigenes]
MKKNKSLQKSNYNELFEKNKKPIMIGSVVLVAIIASSLAYGIGLNKNVKAWENKVYPGVNVYGVDIGGLTKEEAIKSLNEKLSVNIMDKTLSVTVREKSLDLRYSDLNPSYDVETIATDAVKYGKDGSNFAKNSKIKNDKSHNIEWKISYDEDKLKEFEDTVKSTVDVESKDAKISINSGNIGIIPEVVGNKIDEGDLHNKLVENINGNSSNKVELNFELKESKARVTKEDLSKVDGKISSYSSKYRNTGDGRVKNMEIAAQTVNGVLLMPGDEFSYNDLIGDTTPDKGYEKANTYVGNKIVPDYGGGICQVSTTLYRAVMKANIRSTARTNHSLTVSYSEPGLDATVSYGSLDYKFKNTYDFPVYIEGYIGGGNIGFNIYGNQSGFGEKTYELVNEVHETYKPGNEYVDDPTLEVGKEVVQSSGMTGYKASSYQVTYENGAEVKREIVATDVYGTTNNVVKRGTKKPVNTPPPANVATPTPVPTPVPAPKVAQ